MAMYKLGMGSVALVPKVYSKIVSTLQSHESPAIAGWASVLGRYKYRNVQERAFRTLYKCISNPQHILGWSSTVNLYHLTKWRLILFCINALEPLGIRGYTQCIQCEPSTNLRWRRVQRQTPPDLQRNFPASDGAPPLGPGCWPSLSPSISRSTMASLSRWPEATVSL